MQDGDAISGRAHVQLALRREYPLALSLSKLVNGALGMWMASMLPSHTKMGKQRRSSGTMALCMFECDDDFEQEQIGLHGHQLMQDGHTGPGHTVAEAIPHVQLHAS